MNATTATYDEPSVWAPLLVEWAETMASVHSHSADTEREHRRKREAEHYEALAATYRAISFRACQRILVAADNKRAEINDEPPLTLLALPGWLMRRMHNWLPWVRPETWQSFAAMVLADRERGS